MRLIDADELKTTFPTCDNSKSILIASVRATINHMPTIERKKGKWIDETFEPWGLVYHPYKCNQCGEHSEAASNYCPNCGSEMRGYDEGTADDI